MREYDCAIVGGGAAGLFAANALAEAGRHAVILEKQDRVGRKLLSTGNGRCNFANAGAAPGDYRNGFAAPAIRAFPPKDVIAYFYKIGIPARIDGEGRAYPMSGQAASVLDALRLGAAEKGAEICAGFAAKEIRRVGDGFCVIAADGRRVTARNVLLATGGLAAPKLGAAGDGYRLAQALGHSVTQLYPSLSPIKVAPGQVKGLKGVRAECDIALLSCGKTLRQEHGEVLFGDGSVSGIAAMQLAADAEEALARGERPRISIAFGPAEWAAERARALPMRPAWEVLGGAVAKAISQSLCAKAGIPQKRAGEMTNAELNRLGKLFSGWEMDVVGTGGFESAQVTRGGLDTKDFFPDSMESRLCPGLYAAGEVLDVDGGCGGYNLTWAWASAMAAVKGMCGDD